MIESPTILRAHVAVNEDGTATILAQLGARDGTGALLPAKNGVSSGKKFLKQADLSTITCTVRDQADLSTVIVTPTITISSVVYDTPRFDWPYGPDEAYNLEITAATTWFPTPSTFEVELKFTTTGGSVGWLNVECEAVKHHVS